MLINPSIWFLHSRLAPSATTRSSSTKIFEVLQRKALFWLSPWKWGSTMPDINSGEYRLARSSDEVSFSQQSTSKDQRWGHSRVNRCDLHLGEFWFTVEFCDENWKSKFVVLSGSLASVLCYGYLKFENFKGNTQIQCFISQLICMMKCKDFVIMVCLSDSFPKGVSVWTALALLAGGECLKVFNFF